MDALRTHLPEIAVAAALAWGSGLRLYAVLFLVGLAGWLGWIELPIHLRLLAHPLVLGASGFMTLVEFFADKVPWLDSVWDAGHSFIRIPAGAALAAAVFADSGSAVILAASILGGGIAAGTHLAKAGGRAVINTSPEPFTNWIVSLTEDGLVPAGLWLAITYPMAFIALLGAFAIAAVLLLRQIARGLGLLLARLRVR
jgi:hypothetical protein